MSTNAIPENLDQRRNALIHKLFFLNGIFGSSNTFTLPIDRAPESSEPGNLLAGKIVLVTGASRGIGKSACDYFVNAGCMVIGTSRMQQPLSGIDSRVHMVPLDVRDENSVKRCIDTVVQRYGKIDILVNNAGIGQYGRLISASIEDWQQLFEVNLFGVHRVTVAAYPHMKGSQSRIITLGSLDGGIGYPYQAIYAIGKRALQMWNDMFMLEQRHEDGPTFTILEPSWVKTGFSISKDIVNTEPHSEDRYARLNQKAFVWLTEHYGIEPDEVGKAIVAIAAAKKPRLRYFIGPRGPILQGKTLDQVLEMALTKPAEETVAFFESQIDFLYALFAD